MDESAESSFESTVVKASTSSIDMGGGSARLSFLAIAVLMLGLLVLVWLMYFAIKSYRVKHDLPPPLSPNELWLKALTHYPFCFLVASVTLPVTLSLVAFARSEYVINVNLDFEAYLDISSDLDIVANNYAMAQQYQKNSYLEAKANCRAFGGSEAFKPSYDTDRRLFENDLGQFSVQLETDHLPAFDANRILESNDDATSDRFIDTTITVIYQNPKGGNVFTSAVLESVYDFEQSVKEYPGYRTFCRKLQENNCAPFESLVSYLYPAGFLVDDIEGVLGAVATNAQVDQYFGPENLQSNITKTFMYFQGKEGALHDFLEDLYRELLWERDQDDYYPDMVYTWENGHLLQLEANDALNHDTLWSIGSLVVIGVMIFLKVQDGFIFFFGMLGLLLAFTTSYYWCLAHFGIPEITLLHVSGLFVMLGIGADDIFLMIDSYEHANLELEHRGLDGDENSSHEDDHSGTGMSLERIRNRMLWAYSTAGCMMLVSSVTAAVCFFSNAFGVLLVIQEFGIYMGMVVLINFSHVMTILPSAILVNEIYVKPWKEKYFCSSTKNHQSKGDDDGNLDSEVNIVQANDVDVEDDESKESGDMHPVRDELITTSEISKDAVEMMPQPLPQNQDNVQTENLPSARISETPKMSRIDSLLLEGYAPFLIQRRVLILVVSVGFAILLGIFGVLNLEFSDGSIVIFSDAYNQGRLTSIKVSVCRLLDVEALMIFVTNLLLSSESYKKNKYYVAEESSYNSGGGDIGSSSGGGAGSGSAPVSSPTPGGNIGTGDGGGSGGGGSSSGGNSNGEGLGDSNGGGGFGDNGGGDSGNGGGGVDLGDGNGGSGSGGNYTVPNPVPTYSVPITPRPAPSDSENIAKKESRIKVKLIWGIDPNTDEINNPWLIESTSDEEDFETKNGTALLDGVVSGFDLSTPDTQQWLLDVVLAVKKDDALNVVKDEPTWVEMLHEFAMKQEGGFPVADALLMSYIEILKSRDTIFNDLVKDEIGTLLPGLAGETFFTSVTFQSEESASLTTLAKWTTFADHMNKLSPPGVSPMVAQSDLFWNEARAAETIDATVNTWLIANGLCSLIILFFTLNFLLCFMVMATIMLMFFCISGLLFAIFDLPLGPVQALGVSVFIGLSANYSLHVVHAYHRSDSDNRRSKVKKAVFITGSPICASAFSTIGGCVFLFGCRTAALVELGILICCVTTMALVYSMGFLLALLLTIGPLPCSEGDDTDGHRLHKWDIYAMCYKLSRCLQKTWVNNKADEKEDNNDLEVHSQPEGQDSRQRTTLPIPTNLSNEEMRSQGDPERTLPDHAQKHVLESDRKSSITVDELRKRKEPIEEWQKEKKEGSDRSLMSFQSGESLVPLDEKMA
jgi:predicted RND superfamily exporter protein